VSRSPSSQRAQTSDCKKTCQTGKNGQATKKKKNKKKEKCKAYRKKTLKINNSRGCWPLLTTMTLATTTTLLATCCNAATAGHRKTPET